MPLASDARAIARAGIRAADPYRATSRLLRADGAGVKVAGRALRPLPGGRIVIVALGKAAGRMASAAVDALGPATPGLAVTTPGSPRAKGHVRTLFGDHPVPGPRSLAAGKALLRFVSSRSRKDVVLFLISGGGSSLAESPIEGVTLADLRRATEMLLATGAPIEVENGLRTALSRIKGGQLAARVPSGRYATIAISDVVGDPPGIIASGPTVPSTRSLRSALRTARRAGYLARLPPRVRARLNSVARQPAARAPARPATFVFAATNATALSGAGSEARRRGYRLVREPKSVVGDTRRAALQEARAVVRIARAPGHPATARISGGETTVTLGRRPGRGGRNQEFALAAASPISGLPAVVLSIGTDGIDGPTDAAGGWVDGGTAARARERGLNLSHELARHNAYPTLERLGTLVRTGPTGTNVTDLHISLIGPPPRRRIRSV